MSRTPSSYRPLKGRFPTDPSSSVVDPMTSIPRPIPLSPPDTELLQDQYIRPHDDTLLPPDHNLSAHEVPASRIRRLGMPNVAYTNAGLTTKDARSSQRQSKWLIVVCPPKSLNREPPILGHTLSSAPAGRFSSGILIPLFPTLYAQLTAIAREFNMPSTTGLCVYLQLQDSSSPTFNPRISDETWQILWASYFSDDKPSSQLSSHGLPVCGRIEFDIDLGRAKWYNAWMGFSVRDSEGVSREPSVAPSHWRGESRTSFFHPEVHLNTDEPPQDALSGLVRRPGPRPLILENRESLHRHSSSRTSIRNVFHDLADHENTLPAPQAFVPNTLSPMVQELEETESNKNEELNNIVKKWRESSIIASSAPPDKEVSILPSLDPTHAHSNLDVELKLDLNEYSWSISSAGPLQTPASPGWPEKPPSIHLADRLQVSRCNTPTICTSWGSPSENEDIPDSQSYHLPSPDLGWRMLDFVPLTPSTCTTWRREDFPSPAFSRPSSPISSVDIGMRATGSAPMTPSTCTTWGPDDELHSPMLMLNVDSFENLSIDGAMRGRGSAPVTPSIATSWGPADTPVLTPYSLTHLLSPDIDEREFDNFDGDIVRDRSSCWPHIWPYTQSSFCNGGSQVPWLYVWPYVQQSSFQSFKLGLEHYPDLKELYSSQLPKDKPIFHSHVSSYPFLQIYSPVYPYNLTEIYSRAPTSGKVSDSVSTSPQSVKLSLEQYPDLMGLYSSRLSNDRVSLHNYTPSYPVLRIYSPVYPHNLMEIYSEASANGKPSDSVPSSFRSVKLSLEQYPDLLDLYSSQLLNSKIILHSQASSYPVLRIYSPVYPHNLMEIYSEAPANGKPSDSISPPFQSVKLSLEQYPDLLDLYSSQLPNSKITLHSQASSYPVLQIYSPVYPHNLMELYSGIHSTVSVTGKIMPCEQLTPSFFYPFLQIYSSVYPFNLMDLYPEISQKLSGEDFDEKPESVYLVNGTPSKVIKFDYPFFDIYPSVHPRVSNNKDTQSLASNIDSRGEHSTLDALYPKFDIYPPVYPFCLEAIYPEIAVHLDSTWEGEKIAISRTDYPLFNLYPAVYPFNLMNIYHQNSLNIESTKVVQSSISEHPGLNRDHPSSQYPSFNIYPAVYPFHFNEIYPSSKVADVFSSSEDNRGFSHSSIPHTAGYPYSLNNIYAQKSASEYSDVESSTGVSLKLHYPHLDIYRAVYPYSLMTLYPPIEAPGLEIEDRPTLQAGVSRYTSTYPFFDIYPPVYPYSLDSIYPSLHFEFQLDVEERLPLSAPAFYPNFDIYPAVYPFNLEKIYPSVLLLEENSESCSRASHQATVDYGVYPHLTIYSSGYPWNLNYIYELDSTLEDDELGSQGRRKLRIQDKVLPTVDENVTIYDAAYPTFAIYPAQYPFLTIYSNTSSTICTRSQPVVEPVEYLNEDSVYRYPFIDIYPSVYPHVTPYPQLPPSIFSSASPARVTSMRLSNHGFSRRPVRTLSEHSTPPPIPVKPRILQRSISLSKPSSLKPVKQRRTHHELYMTVFDEVQRALAGIVSEAATRESESKGTSQKHNPPSLRPKPAVAPRYVPSPTSDRERRIPDNHIKSPEKRSTHSSGSASPPSQTMRMQTTSTFNGHVSASIHSRVQSMHLHSLSKAKEEESDTGLNRSKSLSDKTKSSILDRARIFSTGDKKVPPLVPSKPLSTFSRPKPSYI